jgi:toxin ParE1/3/4
MKVLWTPGAQRRLPQYAGDVREVLERPFRLIYRVRADRIEVITLLHYRQLLPSDIEG